MRKKLQGRSRSKSKTIYKCFICCKDGHFKKNCHERKNKKNYNSEVKGDASTASEGYDSCEVLVVSNADNNEPWVATKIGGEGEWVMDSGCSYHIFPGKDLFTNYKPCKVTRIGTVRQKLVDGTMEKLTNVRHVPDIKRS